MLYYYTLLNDVIYGFLGRPDDRIYGSDRRQSMGQQPLTDSLKRKNLAIQVRLPHRSMFSLNRTSYMATATQVILQGPVVRRPVSA